MKKVIQMKARTGKTTACYNEALKLLDRGSNVVFLTPFTTAHARILFDNFWNRYLAGQEGLRRFDEVKAFKRNLTAKAGSGTIKFMSFEEYKKQIFPNFTIGKLVIFDDLDMLVPGFQNLYAVSVSGGAV